MNGSHEAHEHCHAEHEHAHHGGHEHHHSHDRGHIHHGAGCACCSGAGLEISFISEVATNSRISEEVGRERELSANIAYEDDMTGKKKRKKKKAGFLYLQPESVKI